MNKLAVLILAIVIIVGLSGCIPEQSIKDSKTSEKKIEPIAKEPVTGTEEKTELTNDVKELNALSEDLTDTEIETDLDNVEKTLNDW